MKKFNLGIISNRNLGISLSVIVGVLLLTQYQNCGSSGSGLNLGNTNNGSSGGIAVTAIITPNGSSCNAAGTQLIQSITGAGNPGQICLEYILSAAGRTSEVGNCTYVAINDPRVGWTYNQATDTWTGPTINLKGNAAYVPGTYTIRAMNTAGTAQGAATFRVTANVSPEPANCN